MHNRKRGDSYANNKNDLLFTNSKVRSALLLFLCDYIFLCNCTLTLHDFNFACSKNRMDSSVLSVLPDARDNDELETDEWLTAEVEEKCSTRT